MFNDNNQKPPAFPLSQPPTPEQIGYNWNVNDMPWKTASTTAGPSNAIMMFNGMASNNNIVAHPPIPSTSGLGIFTRPPRVKRKSESDDFIPNKHFVSEEKMVAHMNGLHLSDNFQSHSIHQEDLVEEADMEAAYVNLTPQELEQRLKKAQRITLCDQVRKNLREDNEIIPKALLNRIEEPCRALILWRPPPVIEQLIVGFGDRNPDEDEEAVMDDNNNNSDPNNNTDMEMDV